jgi:hypothetical protein
MSAQLNGRDPHWNYFLALDDDFLRLARFIEFSSDNLDVYSIELARLLMTAAAEVDVVARHLCKSIDPNSRADSINEYREPIVGRYPKLLDCTVCLPRYELALAPWKEWSANAPPAWWTGNNKVKHGRGEHFRHANLRNALHATAGLLVILLVSYETNPRLAPIPTLFNPNGSFGYVDRDAVHVFRAT